MTVVDRRIPIKPSIDRLPGQLVLGVASAVLVGGLASVLGPNGASGLSVFVVLAAFAFRSPKWFTLTCLPLFLLIPPTIRLSLHGLPDATPLRLVIFLALLGWLLKLSGRSNGEGRSLPVPFLWTAGLFVLYVLAISLGDGVTSISRGVSYSIEAMVTVWAVWLSIRSRRDLFYLIDWLIAIATIAALLGVYEAAVDHVLIPEQLPFFFHAPLRGGHVRVQSVFPHPIVLGAVLAMLLPVAMARLLTVRAGRRPAYVGVIFLFAFALIETGSRGPWIGAIAGTFVLIALVRGSQRLALISGLAISLIILAFSPFGSEVGHLARGVVQPDAGQEAGANTVQYRKDLWHATSVYAVQHPFGAGPGRSEELSLWTAVGGNSTNLARSIDNAYAKYALELGLVGLALFLLLLCAVVTYSWVCHHIPQPDLSITGSGLIAAQVVMLTVSATVATFTWAQLGGLFWVLVGAAFGLRSFGFAAAPASREAIDPSQAGDLRGATRAWTPRNPSLRSGS
jgi:O-Antigen ligase